MMYSEFEERCKKFGVPTPSMADYAEIIEPVYTYHPTFERALAKDYCASMYAQYGLGIFMAMRPEADAAQVRDQEIRLIRCEIIKLEKELDEKLAEIKRVQKLWDCQDLPTTNEEE